MILSARGLDAALLPGQFQVREQPSAHGKSAASCLGGLNAQSCLRPWAEGWWFVEMGISFGC
jgi:hypothetical protein